MLSSFTRSSIEIYVSIACTYSYQGAFFQWGKEAYVII
ncbi:hypothetical protein BTJ44_01651 [Bacillus mycoides]|nr:hypothetical protein BTJ44_01651 [Bacillus mycoides]